MRAWFKTTLKSGSTNLAAWRSPRSMAGFVLRREPLYHKLQYAKVPKFDAAAAALGVGLGAVIAYLGLSSLGSAGGDLTDLTTLCWYTAVWVLVLRLVLQVGGAGRAGLAWVVAYLSA